MIIAFFTSLHVSAADKTATSISELNQYVNRAKPGDHIFLKDGVYTNAVITFSGNGSEKALITISPEHPGKVSLEGNSSISFSGQYLHIRDFVFQKGGREMKSKQVIEFRTSDKEQARYCTVSDCVINTFNNTVKTEVNTWVGIYGEYNVVERCLFKAKDNMGPTLVVWLENGKPAHHTITGNYFLTRQNGAQVDNGLESIRIGDSKTSFTDANCVIAFNRFEDCDGEIEIISNKSCHNTYYHNTFYNCDGGLTLRHGNHVLCDGNFFDGHDKKLSYGIRFIGEGHVAINNYFKDLHGAPHEQYRSPVSVLNGLVNTPINGYFQVKSATIANNIFEDCDLPLIRLGAFSPKRDGMSLAPDSVTILQNIFINRSQSKGEILQVITQPGFLTVSGNRISKPFAEEGKQHFSSATPVAIDEKNKATDMYYKGVGADWVLPAVAARLTNVKYTNLPAKETGPLWMRL
jgi:poly(beta-D-mannuronate) lyase